MTDQRIQEENLQTDLQRWAEAGAPSFDLGAALAQRSRTQRNRWRRWGSIAATLLVLSTVATVSFPAWAATAANWPIVGEPIKAYLAERAGLSWAYEMGFYQANLAELSDGGVTVRVLGVLADPLQTKVFYQIQGLDPDAQPAIRAGQGQPEFPADVRITGFDFLVGSVGSYHPISGYRTADQYFIAETTPIPGESAVLHLRLRVGDVVKSVDLPVSLADSRRFFTEVPVWQSQEHGPVKITLEQLTLSPVEVVATYWTGSPPGPNGGWFARGPLPQPYLRSGGKEIQGRPVGLGMSGLTHLGFARVTGEAQLVIPTTMTPIKVNAQWTWAPGTMTTVEGVPVTLEAIQPVGDEISVDWTYPADSDLLGFGGLTLIGQDGTRLPPREIGSFGGGGGGDEKVAHASVTIELPAGFEPAAIEVSHAVMRIDGPWVFDLPNLPAKP